MAAPLSLGHTSRAGISAAELLYNQLFGEIFSLSLVLASAASVVGSREAKGLLAGIDELDHAVTGVRQALANPRGRAGSPGRAEVLRNLDETVRSIVEGVEGTSLSPSRRAGIWDQAFQVRAVLREESRLSDPLWNRDGGTLPGWAPDGGPETGT